VVDQVLTDTTDYAHVSPPPHSSRKRTCWSPGATTSSPG
jgi:hypothetical protein